MRASCFRGSVVVVVSIRLFIYAFLKIGVILLNELNKFSYQRYTDVLML